MASVLILIPPLFFGIACGLLVHSGLSWLVDAGRALRRRFSLAERLRQVLPDRARLSATQKRLFLPGPLLVGLGAGLILAVLWRHPVLSPWWVVLGGAAGWMTVSARPIPRQALQAVEVLVTGLRSVYPVAQSVSGALSTAAAHLPGTAGNLKAMIEEVLRRVHSGMGLKKSLEVLRASGWPMMGRLSAILEQMEYADEESALKALETLEEQIRASRVLLDRADTVLTLNRLTLRVLQVANLAGVLLVTVVPTWHRFYADRPLGLIAATAMALAGSWYFSSEIRRMEAMLL